MLQIQGNIQNDHISSQRLYYKLSHQPFPHKYRFFLDTNQITVSTLTTFIFFFFSNTANFVFVIKKYINFEYNAMLSTKLQRTANVEDQTLLILHIISPSFRDVNKTCQKNSHKVFSTFAQYLFNTLVY